MRFLPLFLSFVIRYSSFDIRYSTFLSRPLGPDRTGVGPEDRTGVATADGADGTVGVSLWLIVYNTIFYQTAYS